MGPFFGNLPAIFLFLFLVLYVPILLFYLLVGSRLVNRKKMKFFLPADISELQFAMWICFLIFFSFRFQNWLSRVKVLGWIFVRKAVKCGEKINFTAYLMLLRRWMRRIIYLHSFLGILIPKNLPYTGSNLSPSAFVQLPIPLSQLKVYV